MDQRQLFLKCHLAEKLVDPGVNRLRRAQIAQTPPWRCRRELAVASKRVGVGLERPENAVFVSISILPLEVFATIPVHCTFAGF